MSAVYRLGGEGCSYFQQGRCTRTFNRDEQDQARCQLLDARRKMGVKTLDRLERLKRLADEDDREVARRHVINQNIKAISALTCPGFVASGGDGSLCLHQHLIYCLMLLPGCQGRCDYYLRRRDHRDQEGRAG